MSEEDRSNDANRDSRSDRVVISGCGASEACCGESATTTLMLCSVIPRANSRPSIRTRTSRLFGASASDSRIRRRFCFWKPAVVRKRRPNHASAARPAATALRLRISRNTGSSPDTRGAAPSAGGCGAGATKNISASKPGTAAIKHSSGLARAFMAPPDCERALTG